MGARRTAQTGTVLCMVPSACRIVRVLLLLHVVGQTENCVVSLVLFPVRIFGRCLAGRGHEMTNGSAHNLAFQSTCSTS